MQMPMANKPFAEACDQNREPINGVLSRFLKNRHKVLEIGSGTGQHAVYFSKQYPRLEWQTSDLKSAHDGIRAWIEDSGLTNVKYPIELDVGGTWPSEQYDLIFSANTLHILSENLVEQLFLGLTSCMLPDAIFLVYGPFNYGGSYTSASNEEFDYWLKRRDPDSGIKNFEWLQDIATRSGLECSQDFSMPANNRILIWQKIR